MYELFKIVFGKVLIKEIDLNGRFSNVRMVTYIIGTSYTY